MHEFLQQLINGLSLGAIYALIALGYSMVYGLLKFINFAHGDVLMIGAFAGFYSAPWIHHLLPDPWMTTAGVLLWSMLVCAILGVLIELLAYRPLRNQPKLAVLITSIGVSPDSDFPGTGGDHLRQSSAGDRRYAPSLGCTLLGGLKNPFRPCPSRPLPES